MDLFTALILFFVVGFGPREYNVIDGNVVARQNAPVAPPSTLKPIAGTNILTLQQ